jgi:hypothetical protein
MPCSIRDHYKNFRRHSLTHENRGENKVSEDILEDKTYYERMLQYEKELSDLTANIWQYEYLNHQPAAFRIRR